MAFKLILVLTIVALAAAQHGHHDEHHDAPAHYQFAYGVKDGHTGDIKEQEEKRDGHAVSGHYSLVEPDGHTRTVHYHDDGHSGFQAEVSRTGHQEHRYEAGHGHGLGGGIISGGHSAGHGHGHHAESFANVNIQQTHHH